MYNAAKGKVRKMWTTTLDSLPIALIVGTVVALGLTEYLRMRGSPRRLHMLGESTRRYDRGSKSEKSTRESDWFGHERTDYEKGQSDSETGLFNDAFDSKQDKDTKRGYRPPHTETLEDKYLPAAGAGIPRLPLQNFLDVLLELDHRVVMQILMTLTALGVSFYIILSARYDAGSKHWAYGTVGTLFGFWLKGTAASSAIRGERVARKRQQ